MGVTLAKICRHMHAYLRGILAEETMGENLNLQ